MTDAQRKRFYGPAWREAFVKNWRREEGLLVPVQGRTESEHVRAVEIAADQFARIEHGPITDPILRRAARYVALGRDMPDGNSLAGDSLDRVVTLFRLLRDPDDLQATMDWQNPENAARRRCLHFLEENCLEAYVRTECRRLFQTDDFHGLSIGKLRRLAQHLHARPNARKPARVGHGEPTDDEPF